MTEFWMSEWFDGGAKVTGESLTGQDRTDYILCEIADQIKLLNKKLEDLHYVSEYFAEKHRMNYG